MLQEMVFKGEVPLNKLESEIIDKKTDAYKSALNSLIPIKMLIYPYVKDFRRKLMKQKKLLIEAAKKVLLDPENRPTIIKKVEKKYYKESPFYALVMLYIPRIIVPRHIQALLKRFERRTKRYCRQRVRDFTAFLRIIQSSDLNPESQVKDFWQHVFPEDRQFTGYLQAQYEYDRKILKMFKKGSNWRNFYTLDVLNSFTISFIPRPC